MLFHNMAIVINIMDLNYRIILAAETAGTMYCKLCLKLSIFKPEKKASRHSGA